MEERRKPGFVETLMRGWRPAKRDQPSETAETAERTETAPTKASAPTDTEKPEPQKPEPQKPEPNLEERMKGVQGWLAEIERRQRRMNLLAGGAALFAVLAAAGAIALGVMTRSDSATQGDVDELRSQLDGVTEQVTQSTQGQIKSLNDTVGGFDQRITQIEKAQNQVTADIETLRRQVNTAVSQVNQANAQNGGGGGGGNQP